MSYQHIIVETRGRVGVILLNRPAALNALNMALIGELAAAVDGFEADQNIGCMVITGSDKAFAAGADIKEMATKSYHEAFMGDFVATWDRVAHARKPVIAAASSPISAMLSALRAAGRLSRMMPTLPLVSTMTCW